MTKLIKRASAEARAFRLKPGRAAARDRDDHALATIEMPRRPRFAPVTFSELDGVRYLHFGTEWVQGAMRLKHPWRIELEYARQMMAWLLFIEPPLQVTQLGLGTAALTKFCYKRLRESRVTAVELNPAVVIAAHTMFGLPPDDARLTICEADAWDFVTDPLNRGTTGALQIDLYDATARGPVLDSVAFYRACRACLSEPGVATINLFGDHPSFKRNMRTLNDAFEGRVVALPDVHDGNRVALAFAGPALDFDWAALDGRARHIEKLYGLPARDWLKGLAASRANQSDQGTRFRV